MSEQVKLNPLEILDHERFDGFFDVAVKDVMKGDRYNRRSVKALSAKGILDNAETRRTSITLCAQKRSNLSKRERDMLEHLTIVAGAKLVAYINKQKNDGHTSVGSDGTEQKDSE